MEKAPQASSPLSQIVEFAARHSPYYREAAWTSTVRSGKPLRFSDIPLTPKRDVKDETDRFYADKVPASEGRTIEKYTSGSTGVPLRILKTQRHFKINSSENARLSRGWGMGQQTGVVNTSYAEEGHAPGSITEHRHPNGLPDWRIYTFESGPIADLLCRTRASYFNSRPSVVLGTLMEDRDFSFLRLILTVSEIVSPELRLLIAKWPECRHVDSYGTVETGILAVQCARCGQYHAAHGHAVIETLKDDGAPAKPGEMARVIATPLFNYAMPLLRYDLEDYVVLGDGGGCNMPGPSFIRIIGRERNLFKLPGGGRVTPNVPPEDILALGIRQYKLIQTKLDEVEFLYVPAKADCELTPEIAQRLVDANLSPQIRSIVKRVETMPLSKAGKFLMHESMI